MTSLQHSFAPVQLSRLVPLVPSSDDKDDGKDDYEDEDCSLQFLQSRSNKNDLCHTIDSLLYTGKNERESIPLKEPVYNRVLLKKVGC